MNILRYKNHENRLPTNIDKRKITYSDLLENGMPQDYSVLEVHTLGANEAEMKQVLEILWQQTLVAIK